MNMTPTCPYCGAEMFYFERRTKGYGVMGYYLCRACESRAPRIDNIGIDAADMKVAALSAALRQYVAAEPVQHGRWVERINHLGHYQYICSACNDYHAFKTDDKPTARDMHEQYRFCRWCGAKMDAKEDAK